MGPRNTCKSYLTIYTKMQGNLQIYNQIYCLKDSESVELLKPNIFQEKHLLL